MLRFLKRKPKTVSKYHQFYSGGCSSLPQYSEGSIEIELHLATLKISSRTNPGLLVSILSSFNLVNYFKAFGAASVKEELSYLVSL